MLGHEYHLCWVLVILLESHSDKENPALRWMNAEPACLAPDRQGIGLISRKTFLRSTNFHHRKHKLNSIIFT